MINKFNPYVNIFLKKNTEFYYYTDIVTINILLKYQYVDFYNSHCLLKYIVYIIKIYGNRHIKY